MGSSSKPAKAAAAGARPPQRFFTPAEVAAHNTPHDCWVSFLGGVYDLTSVVKDNPGRQVAPILSAAGTDVSHWFDEMTGDIRTYVDPDTQLRVPYCPQGTVAHLAPVWPCTGVDTGSGQPPWWQDPMLRVGALSASTRVIRVRNVLTSQEDALEVPSEETVGEVAERYRAVNAHAGSYTWKGLVRRERAPAPEWVELDLNRSLEANGLPDECAAYEAAGLQAPEVMLHVYWNDDLTVA